MSDPTIPRLPLPHPWPIVVDSLCSGVIGGLTTLLVAHLIEEFGGVVGGVLGTVPSTIVISAIGLFFLEKPEKLDTTMNTVPVGMLLCFVILLLWRLLPKYLPRSFDSRQRLVIMVTTSLVVWILLACAMVELIQSIKENDSLGLEILGVISLGVYFVIAALVIFVPVLPVSRKGDEEVSKFNYFGRFSSGFVSTVCGLLLGYWNEHAGGIAIAFPSVILTSMSSLWLTQSETVATSAASPLILGSTTNSIFALLFAWASPILEEQLGSVLGLAAAVSAAWFVCVYGFSMPMVFLLRKKEVVSSHNVPQIRWSETDDNTVWDERSLPRMNVPRVNIQED